jgi:hypothetical protein
MWALRRIDDGWWLGSLNRHGVFLLCATTDLSERVLWNYYHSAIDVSRAFNLDTTYEVVRIAGPNPEGVDFSPPPLKPAA